MSSVSASTSSSQALLLHEKRLALLTGVSILALAVVSPVAAADRPVPTVSRGAKGVDGSAGFFGIGKSTATSGQAGGNVDLTNVDVRDAQKTPAATIEMGSAGGIGGWGSASGLASVPGANGGSAGNVSVTLSDRVDGRGEQTSGVPRIWVYSRGGNGGGAQKDVGAGGFAGSVALTLSSTVATAGTSFIGVRVSSIGGNAGYGGTDASDTAARKGGASGDVSMAILASGVVSTTGRGATAVVVESLGGAGSVRGSGTAYSNPYVTEGGAAGLATFTNAGRIETTGDSAIGAIVQSVGGTGGEQDTTGGGQPGAKGGAASRVTAINNGSIGTSGQFAFGLLAQSVGGKGGKGGGASFSGGDGGDAGDGAAVTVTNRGSIETRGLGAIGVVAQSIGGGKPLDALQVVPVKDRTGGGAGGFGGGLFFGSGGAGGQGGIGGRVDVVNDGSILTAGDKAFGVLAQSIGGSGGGGGKAQAFGFFFDVALGGDGGIGGKGQDVSVTTRAKTANGDAATIETKGNQAAAILAQSVGGGGGIGGDAVSRAAGLVITVATSNGGTGGKGNSAGKVTVDSASSIATGGARSYGIEAMSIGGGGGAGGTSVATAIGASVPYLADVNVIIASAQGGIGGQGATGGQVDVKNSGSVRTGGSDASGILAMSIGGGGGAGGLSDTFSLSATGPEVVSLSVNTAVGGSGGTGGTADKVTVTNSGQITTTGSQAAGIAAYSIGGGGGIGGSADVLQRAVGKGYGMAVNAVLGGRGGSGNKGGRVELVNNGSIETNGFAANGIHALSVGGGGGVGGSGEVKTITGIKAADLGLDGNAEKYGNQVTGFIPVKPKTLSINGVVGGDGGSGGDAGSVDVTNSGGIKTWGSDARGIFAQSIGGGGGSAPAGSAEMSDKVQLSQVVGGKGGAAGNGADVVVRNSGTVETFGDGAYAIQAQSVGGGGGSGGSASSSAGNSFDKELYKGTGKYVGAHTLQAWKFIDNYYRLVSEGGRGIMPKLLGKLNLKPEIPFSVSYNTSIGGNGGAAGNGGALTISNTGNLTTYGASATAVFAQSIGGGGGDAGTSNVSGGKIINLKSATGGDGGANGNGSKVEIQQSGSITTNGSSSFGILGQSIGGGGGNATTGVDKSKSWDPVTLVSEFAGYQTVVGGQNGARGSGGEVQITNSGSIGTQGMESHGIVAQSIGGGGGISILNVNDPYDMLSLKGALTAAEKKEILDDFGLDFDKEVSALEASKTSEEDDKTKNGKASKAKLEARLGGKNTTGNGGAVKVDGTGSISTAGVAAFGVFVQSIGGGGGFSTSGKADVAMVAGRIGGTDGAKGDGGTVSVALQGSARIDTAGFGSHGIFAQSIGGGGGYGGTTQNAPAFVAVSNTAGDGSKVDIIVSEGSVVLTQGKKAHGVFVQSLGGGGGWVTDLSDRPDFTTTGASRAEASGKGGAVNIASSGSIMALGADAYAIVAQSGVQRTDGSIDSGRAAGTIKVTVDGIVSGGSGTGAGIRLDGGANNTVTVSENGNVSAFSGRAIIGSLVQDTLINRGIIVGDIDLRGAGTGAGDIFTNGAPGLSGAILRTGPHGIIDLGSTGQLTNYGVVDIGGVGKVADLKVTGNFTQSQGGQLLVDIDARVSDAALRNDRLNVTGSVDLGGSVRPNVIGGLLPGDYTFLTADKIQSIGANSPDSAIQSDSVPVSWAVVQSGNTASLRPTANFVSPLGMTLTRDQQGAANALQELWNVGSRPQALLFADFLSVHSKRGYAAALDELTPESIQDVLHGRASEARAGLNRANSCPAFSGSGTLQQEGDCLWGRVAAGQTAMFGTPDDGGFRQSSLSYQSGLQTEFTRDWFFGLTGAYTRSYLRDADRVTGSMTDAADVSMALKHQVGPWLFAASANVGYAWSDNLRSIDIGTANALARSKSEVLTAAGRLRASYQFLFDGWYVRPYAEVDVLYTHSPGYSETGAQALNLDVRDLHKTLFAFSPNVEVGGRYDIDAESWIRPYGKFGVTMLSDDKFVGRASFQGSNGLGLFSTASRIPDFVGDAGLGVQIKFGNGVELLGEYQSQIGDRFFSHTGSVRLQARF